MCIVLGKNKRISFIINEIITMSLIVKICKTWNIVILINIRSKPMLADYWFKK
jgi:hypothetical protein